MNIFLDRDEAGRRLAEGLLRYRESANGIVLGLPRGGVIVGSAIARRLALPLDIFVSQKIALPAHPELAVGAVTETGSQFWNEGLWEGGPGLAGAVGSAEKEMLWRVMLYRGGRPLPSMRGRVVIVVDDGVATGATFLAALDAVMALSPRRLVAAVPVASAAAAAKIREQADEAVILDVDDHMLAVGEHFANFEPVADSEVLRCLSMRGGVEGPRRRPGRPLAPL